MHTIPIKFTHPWGSKVNDKFWLILNCSKEVVSDIKPKFLPLKVQMWSQIFIKFKVSSYTQNGFLARTILNFKSKTSAFQMSFLLCKSTIIFLPTHSSFGMKKSGDQFPRKITTFLDTINPYWFCPWSPFCCITSLSP